MSPAMPSCLSVAVDPEADGQRPIVGDEGARGEVRSGRRKAVEALSGEPIRAQRRAILAPGQIAARHVVRNHEAGHVVEGVLCRNMAPGGTDHGAELGLPVDLLDSRRQDDRVEGAADRARGAQEHVRSALGLVEAVVLLHVDRATAEHLAHPLRVGAVVRGGVQDLCPADDRGQDAQRSSAIASRRPRPRAGRRPSRSASKPRCQSASRSASVG